MEHKTVPLSDTDRWLAEGGEMGKLILAKDWGQTPLGAIESWQNSLKTAVRILLHSRYPMFIWWGSDHINLYNDAYIPMLGKRHPEALGRPAPDSWADIWSVVGPQAQLVLHEGKATWNEEILLIMERYGYTEETYFTFSYSPAPNDTGGIGGVFCAVTEDTERVLSKRRLQILRALSDQVVQSVELTCSSAAQVLEQNPRDLPFALIYLLDADGKTAHLAGTTNIPIGTKASLPLYQLEPEKDGWEFREIIRTGEEQVITNLEDRFGALPGGDWQESPTQAIVLPLSKAGQSTLVGFFVAGISPRLQFDDNYRGFMKLVAGNLATAITNAGAYEEERRRAESLAELDRAKTAFFSNVSHEFRTPLTLMLSPLEHLLEGANGSLNHEQRHELELAQRSGLRLLKLVNTLLDFSRLEAGRVQAVYEAVDLAEFTAELASVFRSAVERAGMRLMVNCPPLSEAVYVDREMWEKIVLNLLSNAFKFTFSGEIEVSLQETNDTVELRVRDTGVGIPESEQEHIFERFYRSKESQGRTYEGTGIGLSLVQELARLHGGTVTVASVSGEGSIFTVTIPKGSAHLPNDRVQNSRPLAAPSRRILPFIEEADRWLPDLPEGVKGWQGEGMKEELTPSSLHPFTPSVARILLADDNADMREYVQRLLRPYFEVEAVADGLAALAAARRQPPDLVLTDVMMPRLDGFGLLKALRDDEATRTIPILLLSARAGEESKIEGLDAGADDYLIKPFSARELLARVRLHLKMAQIRRETVQSIQESEERYRAFVTQSSEAIWRFELEQPVDITLPADSQIERFYQYAYLAECNDRMAQMYGFAKAEEIIGTRLYELLPPTDTANLDYLRAFIAVGYRLTEAESHEVDRDGRPHHFLNNLVGIIENQYLTRAWGTQRDITDRKLAEQQREELLHKEQQARAMAEEANRLKDDFLATVSHELRTPLNAMLGWAKMASQSSDMLLMQQALEVITRNARSQNQIISDILDVSRIITGKLNLAMAKIDLIPVIEAAIETVRPAATAKMIHLETRFDTSWQRVFGDADRLQQVIWNLLSNAVKFTPEQGHIVIQLQRHDQQLELSVSDTGEGIDPEFLPFVFDRFRQGESGASRKHGGLGLGLAIVRHLVELQGGIVEVESQGVGYGTTFRILLPLQAVTGERRSAIAEPAAENREREPFSPVLAGMRILVVDDDDDGRSLLDFLLAQSGATVSLAASVADALQQLEGGLPDVVISDIGMSEQDGYDFIRALRVRHQHLPTIALTAYARQEDRLRALQEGFTQYLSKPLEPTELIAVVAELVGKS